MTDNIPFGTEYPSLVPSPPAAVKAATLPALIIFSPSSIVSFHFCQSTTEFGYFMNFAGEIGAKDASLL